MRHLCLLAALCAAFAGCLWVPPVGGMTPPRSAAASVDGVRTEFLKSDCVERGQVQSGEIISSEPMEGGLPALEAELFENAKARQTGNETP